MKKVEKIINKACSRSNVLTGTGNFVNQYLKLKVAEIQGNGNDYAANYVDICQSFEFETVEIILLLIDAEICLMKQ